MIAWDPPCHSPIAINHWREDLADNLHKKPHSNLIYMQWSGPFDQRLNFGLLEHFHNYEKNEMNSG